jgi:hypothetical protein
LTEKEINFLKKNNEIQNNKKTIITEIEFKDPFAETSGVVVKTFEFFNFKIDVIILNNKILQIKRKENSDPNQNFNLKQMKIENYCVLKLFENSILEIITLEPEKLPEGLWDIDTIDNSDIISNIQNIPRGKHSAYRGSLFIFIKQDCKSLSFCFFKSTEQKFFYDQGGDVPMSTLLQTPDHAITTIEKFFCSEQLILLWTNRQTLIAHNLDTDENLSWLLPIKNRKRNVIRNEISFIDGLKIIDFDEKNEMITLEDETNLYFRLGTYIPSQKAKVRACIIREHDDGDNIFIFAYFEKQEEVKEIKNLQKNQNQTKIIFKQ